MFNIYVQVSKKIKKNLGSITRLARYSVVIDCIIHLQGCLSSVMVTITIVMTHHHYISDWQHHTASQVYIVLPQILLCNGVYHQ